jgi:hypothetical protein
VLIGEDALDAGVAALAGITGGQIIVPLAQDTDRAIEDALDAARLPFVASEPVVGRPSEIETCRRGGVVRAVWSGAAGKANRPVDLVARAAGALAAALAVPLMEEAEAAKLAAEEGIVCHLTSLVLVDEAGEASESVPATRKIDLSRPRTFVGRDFAVLGAAASSPLRAVAFAAGDSGVRALYGSGGAMLRSSSRRIGRTFDTFESQGFGGSSSGFDGSGPAADFDPIPGIGLAAKAASIDWDAAPDALRAGDLSSLPPDVAAAIRLAAASAEIVSAAVRAGMDPVAFVVALLARAAVGDRTAGRIARAALKGVAEAEIAAAAKAVGI